MKAEQRRKSLRALVHVHSLALGGTQLNALDFAEGLREHNVLTRVVGPVTSLPEGPSIVDVARGRGLDVQTYLPRHRLLGNARILEALAKQFRADVVHAYSSWGYRAAYWGPCLLARRPLIQTIYEMDVDPDNFTRTPLVVGTGYLLDQLQARPGRTVLISPPVDVKSERPGACDPADLVSLLGIPDEARRIVTVTRLDENMKALSVRASIDAMTMLGDSIRDVVLIIVGTGDAEEELRDRGRNVNQKLGREAIVFTGPLVDPRPAYSAADVVIGMGGSAARALAFGRALIVQGERGWSDIFRPETAASIFRSSFWNDLDEPTPATLLAGHLRSLLQEDQRRTDLGEFGRRFAEEHFANDAMSARLAGLYASARKDYVRTDWLSDLRCEARVLARRVGGARQPPHNARQTHGRGSELGVTVPLRGTLADRSQS